MIRVGQKLRDERIKKKLSLEDVERATKIRSTFLIAIEKGEYEKLPSAAYAIGFVKNYASFLGLPQREITALFRREFDEEKMFQVLPDGFAQKKEFPLQKIKIQQALVVVFLIFLIIAGFLAYQYRYAFINPPLTVTSPLDGAVVKDEVNVVGTTLPTATVYINEVPVIVNNNGEFTKKISVFPGKNTITIVSRSRFNKESVIKRTIEVKE